MQRLIFNGFMVVLGKGWGGGWCFIVICFLQIGNFARGCSKNTNPLTRKGFSSKI
jgi:hypothetical protein